MAKIYLNRLTKKYDIDPTKVRGGNYRTLMNDILARNTKNIAETTAKLSNDHWNKTLKKVSTKEKRFIMPDLSEVIPDNTVFIRKTAEQGQLITNTLRDKLSKDLTDVLSEFRTKKTDEQAFIRRRGTQAGTVNPELIRLFQEKITETFEAYTKTDPRFGVPPNVKTIATTEARSAINDLKEAYVKDLMKRNPDIKMRKRWKQNKSLAKHPRVGHSEVNGTSVDFDEMFLVPLYKEIKGKFVRIGTTPMSRPHDPNAPLEQIVGCNCDVEHFAEIKKE